MHRLITIILIAFLAVGMSKSDKNVPEKPESMAATHAEHGAKVMNNVVAMDAEGNRTAMCACGAEVAVMDDTPTMKNGDMTMFVCEKCASMKDEMTEEQKAEAMKDFHQKFMDHKFASNTMMKDGETYAKCGCGKEFKVTGDTPVMIENGVKIHTCSEGCAEHVKKMSAEQRMQMEKAMVQGM